MAKQRFIQWKAFFMLVSFAASFTVFCHCETVASAAATASCCQRSCCEKKQKDDHGCQGMQAVKLNLQDKQTTAAFHLEVLPMVLVDRGAEERDFALRSEKVYSVFWAYKLFPDRQSLYQCFII
jgi:hypothetical protein